MSGHRTRKCSECGIHDGVFVDGLPVILADYADAGAEWLLCDTCAEALRDSWDEQNTQRCLNNYINFGKYC